MPIRRLPICVRRTYRDDSLQAVLDRQPRRPRNRYSDDELARIREADAGIVADLRLLAVDSTRTAEAMIKRARPVPGETPAQMVARLQAAAAKDRS
jgi:hypothetical protein